MFKKSRFTGILLLVLFSVLFTGCFGFLSPDPEFSVEGVENEKTYNEPVTIKVTPEKDTTVKLLLNDKEFENGDTVSGDGEYVLEIIAKSKKKETKTEIKFTIETGAPEITVEGVEDGEYYSEAVTPKIIIGEDDERTDIEVKVTLNGKEYQEGTAIEEHGEHVLVVTATKGEKSREEIVKFEIGEPAVQNFRIIEDLDATEYEDKVVGFTVGRNDVEKGHTPLQYNTEIVPNGQEASIELIVDDNPDNLRVRDFHPDWVSDWSFYDTISIWMYVEDVNDLHSDVAVVFAYPMNKGLKTFVRDDFVNGWNQIIVNIHELGIPEEDITNTDGKLFEYIVRKSGDELTVYFSNLQIYNSEKYAP